VPDRNRASAHSALHPAGGRDLHEHLDRALGRGQRVDELLVLVPSVGLDGSATVPPIPVTPLRPGRGHVATVTRIPQKDMVRRWEGSSAASQSMRFVGRVRIVMLGPARDEHRHRERGDVVEHSVGR
jgi:hypothetical protein